jgi:hypothetical protein
MRISSKELAGETRRGRIFFMGLRPMSNQARRRLAVELDNFQYGLPEGLLAGVEKRGWPSVRATR